MSYSDHYFLPAKDGPIDRKVYRAVRALSFKSADTYAEACSLFRDFHVVLVVIGRASKERSGPAAFHVQRFKVADDVLRTLREHGRRFRTVRAYQNGKRIAIPAHLRYGYK